MEIQPFSSVFFLPLFFILPFSRYRYLIVVFSKNSLYVACKFDFGSVMCIVFLLILNARNDGIVDRVSYLDVARKEKVGVFIQHPVAVPPQVVIACRKGGRRVKALWNPRESLRIFFRSTMESERLISSVMIKLLCELS